MSEWKIPLFRIYWDEEDVNAVKEAIERGMFWAVGPEVKKFEEKIAEFLGRRYALVFNSGTSALHALLLAHGVGQGDEVVVPSFSFISTANSVLFVGAKPVFADIEEETFGLDVENVQEKITSHTKVIMPMHYGGGVARDITALREIAEDHNIILIEDTAESFGAKKDDVFAGCFGQSAALSFCQTKIFTTGEGGAIVTDNRDIYERAKLVRSHGRAETADYFNSTEYMDYVSLGYNFRMANILAALGISQLKKVEKLISMRRSVASQITESLSDVEGIRTPVEPAGHFHVYQMYTVRVSGGKKTRDALKKHLEKRGIMSRVYFNPIHRTSFYVGMGYGGISLPVTEKISKEVLTLPIFPDMTSEEIEYITGSIKTFFEKEEKERRANESQC